MLTSQIVTIIRQATGWGRAEILSYVDLLHKQMKSQDTYSGRVLDTATGKDPYFTATQGVFLYNISTANGFPSDGYKVIKVYTDPDDEDSSVAITAYGPDSDNATARILFNDDPGTSKYYVRYIGLPASITSESVQLKIPERGGQYDWHFELALGAIGMIEMIQAGGISDKYIRFTREVMPAFKSYMNSQPRRQSTGSVCADTIPRGY